jgi:hypothetical protein
MASRDETLAENQRSFRRGNERLEEFAEAAQTDGHKLPFLCECADESCIGRIEMTADDYHAAHLDRTQYIILPGHLTLEGQTVFGAEHGYQIARDD